MKVFKEPNVENDWVCPICKKPTIKEVVLVGIDRTEDGNNTQAEQIHIDCIELRYYKSTGVLAMIIE